MFERSSKDDLQSQTAWWRERELLIVIALGLVTLCARLDALPLFGEEPRRALIAREMVESGDWLVPGTQRVFLPSRPPLQNWLIAIVSLMTGSFDVWSVRIPSILSTLAVAVLIYGYLRQRSSKLGSSAGAIAFLTMTLVMEFGRSAETEAVFSLFVAASLLLWHWAWMKQWPAWQMWSIGYFFTGLGMLTKGLQAPLYFVAATWFFLIAIGRWKSIITRGQLVGILVFIVTVGLWQGPFTWYRGVADSWGIYFDDVAGRFVDRSWTRFLTHLALFPLEVFFVRLMPWSALLLAFASRRVRRSLGGQRELVLFLTIGIAFSFISVWLPPGSKARYYMPLFPSFAALVGIAIDRLAALRAQNVSNILWPGYIRLMSQTMVGAAIVIATASLAFPGWRISLPVVGAFAFAAAAAGLAYVSQKSLSDLTDRGMARGVYSVATFLALIQICLIVTVQQRRCEDIAGQIEGLKHRLPKEARLVSFGPVHHAFAFFYEEPIPIVPLPADANADNVEYFCLHTHECDPPELPFHWVQVAVIGCDRFKSQSAPKERVIIGRRIQTDSIVLNGSGCLSE